MKFIKYFKALNAYSLPNQYRARVTNGSLFYILANVVSGFMHVCACVCVCVDALKCKIHYKLYILRTADKLLFYSRLFEPFRKFASLWGGASGLCSFTSRKSYYVSCSSAFVYLYINSCNLLVMHLIIMCLMFIKFDQICSCSLII